MEAQEKKEATYDSLTVELELIYDDDQNIRRTLIDSVGLNSPMAGLYIAKMASIDRKNRAKIKSILEKYGWIGKSKISQKASEAIFYSVQHTYIKKIRGKLFSPYFNTTTC